MLILPIRPSKKDLLGMPICLDAKVIVCKHDSLAKKLETVINILNSSTISLVVREK
jgi:hypothetical protein